MSATPKCKFGTLEISGKIIDSFSAGLDIVFGSAFFVLRLRKSVKLRRIAIAKIEKCAIL